MSGSSETEFTGKRAIGNRNHQIAISVRFQALADGST